MSLNDVGRRIDQRQQPEELAAAAGTGRKPEEAPGQDPHHQGGHAHVHEHGQEQARLAGRLEAAPQPARQQDLQHAVAEVAQGDGIEHGHRHGHERRGVDAEVIRQPVHRDQRLERFHQPAVAELHRRPVIRGGRRQPVAHVGMACQQRFQRAPPGGFHPAHDHRGMARVEDAPAGVQTVATALVLVGHRLQRPPPLQRLVGEGRGQLRATPLKFVAARARTLQGSGGGAVQPGQLHVLGPHLAQRGAHRVEVLRQRNHHGIRHLGGSADRRQPQMTATLRQQLLELLHGDQRDAYRSKGGIAAAADGGQLHPQLRPRGESGDTLAERLQLGHERLVVGQPRFQVRAIGEHVDGVHESGELRLVDRRRGAEEILQHARLVGREALEQVEYPASRRQMTVHHRGVGRVALLPLCQFLRKAVVHVVHVQQRGPLQ